MALKKKTVTGMKDILPAEMQVRDYVTGLIKETYKSFGFSSIETPCVEHIENLCSKQGGDNEKLIFKIMKRGEKLNLDVIFEQFDYAVQAIYNSASPKWKSLVLDELTDVYAGKQELMTGLENMENIVNTETAKKLAKD